MRCKICGGELRYQNGLFICINCDSKFDLTDVYENIDVFIAYIENDDQGRRTRDSIIAQELFNKMEGAKITAFYQRISAENLSGDDFETVCKVSAAQSKIILLVGTNKISFEKLIEEYSDQFHDKTVIPVYSDMSAYDLPPELNKLQALNFNNVGAVSDMIKRILQILGRREEIDFEEAVQKYRKKKKKAILISIVIVLIIIFGAGSYVVLGTSLVLQSKKHEHAQALIEAENYAEAINVLSDLSGYKNSDDLLKGIYDRYEGYYQSEDKSTGLHLTISDDWLALVEINETDQDGRITRITENAEISRNMINLAFNDSENRQGNAVIELANNGINLKIRRDQTESEIGSKSVFFALNEKSDSPILEEITAETIKQWLLNGINESELKARGYELVFETALYKDTAESQYGIKNTDIKVALYNHDISKADDPFVDDRTAVGFSAPANILIPDKIGGSPAPYVENDILFVPNSLLVLTGNPIDFWIQEEISAIGNDTMVSCTSKAMVGDEIWQSLLNEYIYSGAGGYTAADSVSSDETTDDLYRVRKSYDDERSQIGAFQVLDNAKKLADSYKAEGYKVFNGDGILVYEP